MMHSQILKDKSITNGIQYLWNIIEQISQDPISEKARDFLTDLPNILFIILGAENKKGWLTQSFEDLNNPSRFSTVNAEENMKQLILLLSPPVISQQVENCHYRENIYTLLFEKELVEGQKFQLLSNVLPEHVTELRKAGVWKHPSLTRFQTLFSSEVSHITDQFIVISPGDWFLFALAFNLKNFRPSTNLKNARSINEIAIDPYVYEFIQNPFLLLIRRYLEYFDFLYLSQMNEHKDKKQLFKKFCFILEEHLIVEQIFNVCPQNIEILLHYSILDGLQYSELRQSYPSRKKSMSNSDNDNTTIQGDSKIGGMYESQLSGGSKIGNSQQQSVVQGSMIINNSSGSGGITQSQQSLISSATDIVDNFSRYTKNTILQHFQSILNIKEFYVKKGKESFTVHSNYIFQALLILLHYKRRHFKLMTISTVYSAATNSNVRVNPQLNSFYSMQGNQRNSQSSTLYANQGSRIGSIAQNNYQYPYLASQTNTYNNTQYQKSSQQYYIRLCQQYCKYREFDNTEFYPDQFQLEYFRDHGEDNMLTLFYKKLSYFLSISLDDWQKDISKQQKETLYDQGRLLASLIGHHKYFERHACENDLFTYLNSRDEFIQISTKISSTVGSQQQNSNANYNTTSNAGAGSHSNSQQGIFGQVIQENPQVPSPQVPSRPVLWQYSLNDQEFDRLLPSLYIFDNSMSRQNPSSSFQQQAIQTNYRHQIGFFNDELSQIRFKILVSSSTILLNKFTCAFSSIKELTLNDYLIFTLLTDIVFKKREFFEDKSINNSIALSQRGIVQDEDLISRLNNLDLITIKHANEFFLLRENNDDVYKLFVTPESLEPIRKIIGFIGQYLKKKVSQKGGNAMNDSNIIDGSFYLSPAETDPVEICNYLLNKLNFIQNRSQSFSGYSNAKNAKGSLQDSNDRTRDSLFQIENKRLSYDYQQWKAPLASFESKILFYIFLQISFFIDYVRNGFQSSNSNQRYPHSKTDAQRYPKTNLRKYANIYVAFSYFLILVLVVLGLRWIFFTTPSSSRQYQTYSQNKSKGNGNSRFQWDLP